MNKNVAIISLGCDKNRVDTEKMMYHLGAGGYSITNDFQNADAVVINTCAFIESARAEAIETILQAAELKKTGRLKKLIVTGCLPQKYHNELSLELKEADAFLGSFSYGKIAETLNDLFAQNDASESKAPVINIERTDVPDGSKRIQSTPNHYAYLKIAEGCDNRCTYCTIPSIRGPYTSRSAESLILEAEGLIKNGVKELIIVAQDTTRYGIDIYGKYSFVPLLKQLSKLPLYKIRLMYCYPELVTDELIEEIAYNEKIAKYIDVPLQHIDDAVLKRMNRRIGEKGIRTLIEKLRNQKTYISIRTSLIAGFPGEDEKAFKKLKSFVKEYKLDNLGVFAYSKEDGTPAAKLDFQVPEEVKAERASEIMEIQFRNRKEYNKAQKNKIIKVIYEDIDYGRNMFAGRSEYNAPEVDSAVYFKAPFADAGEIYDVKITGYDGLDLIGETPKNESTH